MIRIRSKQDGFRRCGVAHPATTVDHPDGTFTPDQVELLQTEPMLMVEIVEVEGEGNANLGKVKPPTAVELIARIAEAKTVEEIGAIIGDDTRKTVIDAGCARKAVLESTAE